MKPSRRTMIGAAVLGALACLAVTTSCLWFAVISPNKARQERIALATEFLEAYSEGDCARAKALMEPARPFTEIHSPPLWNPETFCQEYRIRIVELDNIQDERRWAAMWTAGWQVRFSGKFEITDYGVGPYPCPDVRVFFSSIDKKWVITGWDEQKWDEVKRVSGGYCVSPRHLETPRAWPQCFDVPGVTLRLHKIDNTRIQLVADGLDLKRSLDIFYRPTSESPFRGEVWLYINEGDRNWVERVGRKGVNILANPMMNGRIVYMLKDLPPLPDDSTWEVRLAHRWGVACAQITLP